MKSKQALFRVHFDNFGTGEVNQFLSEQVTRVTRPAVLFYENFGIDDSTFQPIEIDLIDDINDRTRAEVMTQINKQIKQDAEFAVTIDTLNEQGAVIEQWYLRACRLDACRLDDLVKYAGNVLMIRMTVNSRQIATSLCGQHVSLLG